MAGESGRIIDNCRLRAFIVVENWSEGGIETGEGVVAKASGFTNLGLSESFALAVENQFGVVDEGHAVSVGKPLGAFADKINMCAAFENQTGSLNWIAEPLDTGDTARFHAATIHEERVELDAAVGGEKTAPAGVKGWIIFEDGDGRFNGVES
jgi:hypothetical protein